MAVQVLAIIFGALIVIVLFAQRSRREVQNPSREPESDIDVGRFNVQVFGESHYQNHLTSLCGERSSEGVIIVLRADVVPDSSNKFDHEAVRVDIGGLTVGHLPRDAAPQWRRQFGTNPIQCEALIRGGWYRGPQDEGMFGVRLCPPSEGAVR